MAIGVLPYVAECRRIILERRDHRTEIVEIHKRHNSQRVVTVQPFNNQRFILPIGTDKRSNPVPALIPDCALRNRPVKTRRTAMLAARGLRIRRIARGNLPPGGVRSDKYRTAKVDDRSDRVGWSADWNVVLRWAVLRETYWRVIEVVWVVDVTRHVDLAVADSG